MMMPYTEIGGRKVSRLICGTNTFNGYSHFSEAKDSWMRNYFTTERIVEVLERCQDLGVNAMLGPINERCILAQNALAEKGREKMEWISTTTGSLDVQVLKEEIAWAAEAGNKLHAVHCSFVDSHLLTYKNEIQGIEELLAYIRELGMVPGVSTHRPELLTVLQKKKYDINFVIVPFNIAGFLCNVETNWLGRMIRETDIPVIAIKPLASGRLMPEEGLPYCFNNIKPQDAVAIGVLSPGEVEEDVKITLSCLTGAEDDRTLLSTPSKSTITLS